MTINTTFTKLSPFVLLSKLGFVQRGSEGYPTVTDYPMLYYDNSFGQPFTVGIPYKLDSGRWSYTHELFSFRDVSICMLMLKGLSKVSNVCYILNIYDDMWQLEGLKEGIVVFYQVKSYDLCELVKIAIEDWLRDQ